jgi:HEAT repeat protein
LIEFLRRPYEDDSVSYYFFPGGGRVAAIGALMRLADKDAVVPALIEALEDPSWGMREYAAKELCDLGDERAAKALEKLLALPVIKATGESGEPRARMWALRALQKIVGDEVLEWCGTRDQVHSWVSCRCSKCGKILHKWTHGKCSSCGIIRRYACEFTDLHYAIRHDADLEEIRELCRNGLVNVGDEEGFTPLMKASGSEGSLAIVKLLLEFGADINAKSVKGTSALSMAALHDQQDVVEYLIAHGARGGFTVRSTSGESRRY